MSTTHCRNCGASRKPSKPGSLCADCAPPELPPADIPDGYTPPPPPELYQPERLHDPEVGPIVVIPCSSDKTDKAAPVADLYTGSYHHACRRAALAITHPDRVLILSARYGLVPLTDPTPRLPYNERIEKPHGRMGGNGRHVESAKSTARRLGLDGNERCVILAGQYYANVVAQVWRNAERPLDGSAGIGEQRQRLKRMAR